MTEDTRLMASLKKVKNIRQYVFSGRTTCSEKKSILIHNRDAQNHENIYWHHNTTIFLSPRLLYELEFLDMDIRIGGTAFLLATLAQEWVMAELNGPRLT